MFDVLVQFGHQRALAIPLMWTDNVYALGLEGVGGADHGTDVKSWVQFSTATSKS